jgi:hypothetical protein
MVNFIIELLWLARAVELFSSPEALSWDEQREAGRGRIYVHSF